MSQMEWKTLSSEYLVKSQYFTARKDKCEAPGGKIIENYYVVELGLCVCALAITEDNKAILIKQYRHPVKKTMIEIPGGFVDKDEQPEKAVVRELLEETGYQFDNCEFLAEVATNPGVLNNYTQLFLATGGKKVSGQSLDPNEEIEIELVTIDELVKMLMENKIPQSLHSLNIFYALLKLGKLKLV